MAAPRSAYDDFARAAFDVLEEACVPYLVMGGLDVTVVGEPRTIADVDAARRHRGRLDRRDVEATVQELCDLAEDMEPWRRLQSVLRRADEDGSASMTSATAPLRGRRPHRAFASMPP